MVLEVGIGTNELKIEIKKIFAILYSIDQIYDQIAEVFYLKSEIYTRIFKIKT